MRGDGEDGDFFPAQAIVLEYAIGCRRGPFGICLTVGELVYGRIVLGMLVSFSH